MSRWLIIRDASIVTAALLGIFHETVIASAPRDSLLFLFSSMLALPAILRADEKRRGGGNDK